MIPYGVRTHSSKPARCCRLLPWARRQEMSIDCCMTGAQQQRHGAGEGGQCRAVNSSSRFAILSLYKYVYCVIANVRLGSRVVSVLDSGAEGPGFKSQP